MQGCCVFLFQLPDIHQADSAAAVSEVRGMLLQSKVLVDGRRKFAAAVTDFNRRHAIEDAEMDKNLAAFGILYGNDGIFKQVRKQMG